MLFTVEDDADDDIRVERVIKRDGISEAEVRKRMDAQMTTAEKRKYAHVVIDNAEGLFELYQRVDVELMRLHSATFGRK